MNAAGETEGSKSSVPPESVSVLFCRASRWPGRGGRPETVVGPGERVGRRERYGVGAGRGNAVARAGVADRAGQHDVAAGGGDGRRLPPVNCMASPIVCADALLLMIGPPN